MFKIHPGIGVARVGNSEEFFIGPETLEIPPVPAGGYRDDDWKIRRQAARFRVFQYDDVTGALVGEVTGQPGYSFVWTVSLRRRQHPSDLTLALLESSQTISGPSAAVGLPALPYPGDPVPRSFGELRTDPEGRLLVLSTTAFPDSTFGFDGLCDGIVQVDVTGPSVSGEGATPSWVMVVAPDFAPGRQPAMSFYDELYQAYVDAGLFPEKITPTPQPSFRKDIFPILRARNGGRPLAPADESRFPLLDNVMERQGIVDFVNDAYPDFSSGFAFPETEVQAQMLERWVGDASFPNGDFDDDWPPTSALSLDDPDELDRGPIRHCLVGGGWEMSTSILNVGPGSPHVEPFRLVVDPSDTTTSFLPTQQWINDILACSWAPQTERPHPSINVPWDERGFMILESDDLAYVEYTPGPYVLLLTPALVFGDVQAGPSGSTAYKSLPISFEIHTGVDEAPVSIVGAPLGFSWTSVPPVPSASEATVHLWVTYDTSLITELSDGAVITVDVAGESYEIPVSGSTVEFQNTKLVLALDCSSSMLEPAGPGVTKSDSLKTALDIVIGAVREGDALGFAPFSTDALDPAQPLLKVGPNVPLEPKRQALRSFVNDHLPVFGNTAIGDGLTAATALLPTPGETYAHEAIVVVTDGKETADDRIATVAGAITVSTFAIGIGTASNVDFGTLQTLTGNRGGVVLLTGDPMLTDNYYSLTKNLLQILHGASNEEIIIDPPGTLLPGEKHKIEIPITEAETSFKATVLSDQAPWLRLALQTPSGLVLDEAELMALPGVARVEGEHARALELYLPLVLPDASTNHVGIWRLQLTARYSKDDGHEQDEQPRDRKRISYSALVAARSAIRFRAQLTQTRDIFRVEATTSVFGGPPRGSHRIVAEVRGPNGLLTELRFSEAEPGRHVAEYKPISLGDYSIRVRAHGQSRAGHRFSRELSLWGAAQGASYEPWREAPPAAASGGGADHDGDACKRLVKAACDALNCLLERCKTRVMRRGST